jgi:nucleotide-binding universal stress UspA family protein
VVGSRNLGAVERLLQGSVSEHIASHAATTVLVAR